MDSERSPGIVPDPSIEAAAEMRVRRIEPEEPMAEARLAEGDEELDRSLRPPRLAEFVAQEAVTSQLEVFIEAARRRNEPLDHVLLSGPPGLGKTSLAHIIAAEMGAGLVHTAAPALERKADVAAFLTSLEPGSRLLHRRDPPPQPVHRGDALSRDGGPPAAGGARPGRRRANGHARSAAVHPRRRDDASGPPLQAASRPLRRVLPPRALRGPTTSP